MPSFTVQFKDLETGIESATSVTGPFHTQEEAEAHIASLPTSKGGTHRGIQVIPKNAPAKHEGERA